MIKRSDQGCEDQLRQSRLRWPELDAELANSSYFSAPGSGGVVFGGARWCVACS